jgi:hypothetical protein
MTYQKPEITVLGDAARLIQGNKTFQPLESGSSVKHQIPDSELDD